MSGRGQPGRRRRQARPYTPPPPPTRGRRPAGDHQPPTPTTPATAAPTPAAVADAVPQPPVYQWWVPTAGVGQPTVSAVPTFPVHQTTLPAATSAPGTDPGQSAGPSHTEASGAFVSASVVDLLSRQVVELQKHLQYKGDLIDKLSIPVSADLKHKILSGKYIDLSDLLPKSAQSESDTQITYAEDAQGHLIPKSVKKRRYELSIAQWTSAFHTFMSVYVELHPDDVQDLLAYMELIRSAARDHPVAWRTYDEEFRTKKAADPARPWGMIDSQLWLSHFCKPTTPAYRRDLARVARTSVPTTTSNVKICHFYNSSRGCRRSPCDYSHLCSVCAGRHPEYACKQSQSSRSSVRNNNPNWSLKPSPRDRLPPEPQKPDRQKSTSQPQNTDRPGCGNSSFRSTSRYQ